MDASRSTKLQMSTLLTDTGKITDISDESFPCSTTIIDVHQDIILASRSSMKQPSQVSQYDTEDSDEFNSINILYNH